MIEEWKVIKEWNGVTTSTCIHCTGDKLYVSNTGKVRLNDIELTLDKGLYIKNGEICIVGTSWPFRNIHRTIYQLFTGKLKKGYGWNIHHIDGNHYNNRLDNLVQVTTFEHGKIHAEHDNDWGDNNPRNREWVKQQEARRLEVIEITKQWYRDRVNDYLAIQKESTKTNAIDRYNKTQQRKLEREKLKQQKIEEKLASGDYYYNKAGVLRPKHRCDKGRKHSKEWGDKISATLSKACEDGTFKIANKGKKRYFNSETNKFYYK